MKKSKIAVAVFTVIMAAASAVKAENIKINFDDDGNSKNGASLRDVIASISEDSGFLIPEIPARKFAGDTNKPTDNSKAELFEITGQGKGGKTYLEAAQGVLKKRLIDAYRINTEIFNAVNKNDAKVLFDKEEIYITSADFNVYAELRDIALAKNFALLIPAKNKGVCTTIIKYGKRCNAWANAICTAYELYQIIKEVCPPAGPADSPGVSDQGGTGGQPLHPLPFNPPVRTVAVY